MTENRRYSLAEGLFLRALQRLFEESLRLEQKVLLKGNLQLHNYLQLQTNTYLLYVLTNTPDDRLTNSENGFLKRFYSQHVGLNTEGEFVIKPYPKFLDLRLKRINRKINNYG